MSIFRLIFAGQIKKCEHRTAGQKPIVEVSLCRKISKKDEPEVWNWIKVTVWEPAEYQVAKLRKGAFIAGSGEFKLRSYEKDGVKGSSAEVSCRSFDIEVSDGEVTGEATDIHTSASATPRAPIAPRPPAAASAGDDEPPF